MTDKKEKKKVEEVSQAPETVASRETEYLEIAQRIKAEFENYKKRNAEVASQSLIFSGLENFLVSVDNTSFVEGKIENLSRHSYMVLIQQLLDG